MKDQPLRNVSPIDREAVEAMRLKLATNPPRLSAGEYVVSAKARRLLK